MNFLIWIALIFILVVVLYYFWSKKPCVFKSNNLDELYRFLSILLYRGYSGFTAPNGRMYLSLGKRQIIFKKYRLLNDDKGIYVYIEVESEIFLKSLIHTIEEMSLTDDFWLEETVNNRKKMLVVDIRSNFQSGISLINNVFIIREEKTKRNCIMKILFINTKDRYGEFIDYKSIEIPNYISKEHDLNIPVTNNVKVARKLGVVAKILLKK